MAITFTSNLDLRTNRITNVGGPAQAGDAATKQYVDNVAAGLNWKNAVRVAASGNVDVAAPGTIDGVTLAAGDRVLLMGQTNAIENGIYVFDGAALGRAGDADGLDPGGASELRPGTAVTVSEGTDSGNHTYVITTDGPIDIGVTPIAWSLLNAGTAPVYTQGDGIIIGNDRVVRARQATDAGISIGAAGIGVLPDPNGGLQNTANGVGVRVVANTGLRADNTGLRVVVPTTTALYTDADGLQLHNGNGITTGNAGVTAVADPDGGLQVLAAGIGAKLPANPGLLADNTGLSVKVNPDGGLRVENPGVRVLANPAVVNDPAAPSLVVGADGVAVNTALFPRKFAASVTGTGQNIPITHNLNSLDVQVEVYEVATGQTVYADVNRTDLNTVTLGFGTAPAAGQFRAVVVG